MIIKSLSNLKHKLNAFHPAHCKSTEIITCFDYNRACFQILAENERRVFLCQTRSIPLKREKKQSMDCNEPKFMLTDKWNESLCRNTNDSYIPRLQIASSLKPIVINWMHFRYTYKCLNLTTYNTTMFLLPTYDSTH